MSRFSRHPRAQAPGGSRLATPPLTIDLRREIADRSLVDGEIVLVDRFLNHRIEPGVIRDIGRRIAEIADPLRTDVIVTAEASGIPPALATASELGVPMIYAKKYVTPGPRHSFSREVGSATKGFEYSIEIRQRVIDPGLRALVVDDFLARGRTAVALGEIIEEAGCEMLGAAFAVEKGWTDGRESIEARGWPVWAVVTISSVDGGRVHFA